MEMYLCGLFMCMYMCVHKILLLDLGGPMAVILLLAVVTQIICHHLFRIFDYKFT